MLRALHSSAPSRRSLTTSSSLLRPATTSAPPNNANGKEGDDQKAPQKVPSPPKPIDDSTSALDFKLSHPRPRPPPLPKIDPPRWSAEEAVTNILWAARSVRPLCETA